MIMVSKSRFTPRIKTIKHHISERNPLRLVPLFLWASPRPSPGERELNKLMLYFKAVSLVNKHSRMSDLPLYTKSQLALRNGQDKPEIWIAYKGLIYDVSRSRLWRNGKHYEHWAGQDLTHELPDAPHDEWVFEHFDVIGKLR